MIVREDLTKCPCRALVFCFIKTYAVAARYFLIQTKTKHNELQLYQFLNNFNKICKISISIKRAATTVIPILKKTTHTQKRTT